MSEKLTTICYLSNSKPEHITGELRRGDARRSGGRYGLGRDAHDTVLAEVFVAFRGLLLYLDTQGEFALPARDYQIKASVSGWYNRLQQSRQAATGCPACTTGWTPQPQGTYTYLSNPKPGHTTGGSSQSARRGGGAGSGRTGRRPNSSPRRQASLTPPKASKILRLSDSPEARTSEILCKPMEEHNDRLTTVYPRFITGTRSALCSWLLTNRPTKKILPDDSHENDFYVECPPQVSREFSGAPAASDILRVVLIFSFRILGLLVGRHLVGQVCVARTQLLR